MFAGRFQFTTHSLHTQPHAPPKYKTTPQEFGPDHPAVALSLQSLALVLRTRQQLPAAAEAATRCLGIRAQHKSTADGPMMAAALNLKVWGLGGVRVTGGLGLGLLPRLWECLGVLHGAPDNPIRPLTSRPPSSTRQALVAIDSDDVPEALSLAQKGLEIRQKTLASDHPDVGQSLACESH